MDYQDFTIDLRSAQRGRIEATVAHAGFFRDTPRVSFSLPIEEETLKTLLGTYDRRGDQIEAAQEAAKISPRELGQKLFSALFRKEMADLFVRCQAALAQDGQAGLRLRLRFRRDDRQAEYLAALPWEWLWDPRAPNFLAIDLCTPVVRDIAAAQPRGTLTIQPPLRILVVDAAPGTMQQLNLKLEIERMNEALAPLIDAGRVELLQLQKNTPDHLRDALRDDDIHVLHFMGHGGYHSGSGDGAIFFVNEDGSKDQVDGLMLAAFLKRIPSLRLVVLNACKTARDAGRAGAPLSAGVAAAILEQTGVPAVVANQHSISDPTAIAFSQTFYGRVAQGDSVDEALTEVRLRLRPRTREWATPVLFLTASNGKLFAVEEPATRGARTVRAVDSRPAVAPVCLGVRSIVGYGADMEERNDKVLDLSDCFEDRYIKEKEWWQEKIFPDLRAFLRGSVDQRRPLVLDFAAHSSIAFAAGWLLEPKSGLDVRVRQRTGGKGEFEWHPEDGTEPEGALWLDRPDVELDSQAPDVALALSVSQRTVADVQELIGRKGPKELPVGRIVDATIAPEPGQRSVRGGAHALRLAQALLVRLQRHPHEREGRIHLFCAGPNALVFYLGQLASALGKVVLYEFPFRAEGAFGRYQRSIELPPPGEARGIPEGWE